MSNEQLELSGSQFWQNPQIKESHSALHGYMPGCSAERFSSYLWMGQISGVSRENLKGFLLVLLLGVSSISCSICNRYLGLSKCNLCSRKLHCNKHLFSAGNLTISPILLFVPQRNSIQRKYKKIDMVSWMGPGLGVTWCSQFF